MYLFLKGSVSNIRSCLDNFGLQRTWHSLGNQHRSSALRQGTYFTLRLSILLQNTWCWCFVNDSPFSRKSWYSPRVYSVPLAFYKAFILSRACLNAIVSYSWNVSKASASWRVKQTLRKLVLSSFNKTKYLEHTFTKFSLVYLEYASFVFARSSLLYRFKKNHLNAWFLDFASHRSLRFLSSF